MSNRLSATPLPQTDPPVLNLGPRCAFPPDSWPSVKSFFYEKLLTPFLFWFFVPPTPTPTCLLPLLRPLPWKPNSPRVEFPFFGHLTFQARLASPQATPLPYPQLPPVRFRKGSPHPRERPSLFCTL